MQCIRAGSGKPPLVFVHGVGCSRTDGQPQIDLFSKQHAVAACDLRGHGETPGDDAPWLQILRRFAPSVRIETVPGVGHFPRIEAADHVNRLIGSFLGTG